MSTKTEDKLKKLANFGESAGAKPAAAAVAVISPPIPAPKVEESPKATRPEPKPKTPEQPAKPLLIRNVGFTEEDQQHLDRISQLLRDAGEFRPSISDLVRVALRGCTSLNATQAKKILDSSRRFDGRRKH
ncbi:MAG: hypothetical protein ABI073_03860 [Luteolibacter sp.]